MLSKQNKLAAFVKHELAKLEEEERKKIDQSLKDMLEKQKALGEALIARVFDGKMPESKPKAVRFFPYDILLPMQQ